VRLGGEVLGAGTELRPGDVLETQGAVAFFAKNGPDKGLKVAWELEDRSRATVVKDGAALILALERGAVEAQVTPVPGGEAFAVDVAPPRSAQARSTEEAAPTGATRIAVHGTHLRVSVSGPLATVDLNEGVVSIGPAPRAGATTGTLVTAPAHVEIDTRDPEHTLRVDHGPSTVRPPVDLAASMLEPPTRAPLAAAPPIPLGPEPLERRAPASPAAAPAPQLPPPPKADAPAHLPAPDPNAEQTILAAIKACDAGRPKSADNVRVMISSKLELRVGAEGMVELARFDPPLTPELQTCAATTIYKTRFSSPGAVTIALEVER
jgi:hypothetical protein